MRRPVFWLPLCVLALAARSAVGSDLVDFARCISRAGATFYTADWCPHCARQSRMFGDAIAYVRSVDCTAGCDGVQSLPTWTFRDGSRLAGVASFDTLARRTGCQLGQPRRERRDDGDPMREADSSEPRERIAGGATIIEIPRR